MSLDIFETEYLNDYLRMVEETESPRVFHIWSSLWAISAALGRRCWLPFGTFDLFPNQYVLIVGSPASRKSTALSMARKLLRDSTGVRFAPADTGGQRQGLVLAMQGTEEENHKEFLGAAELGVKENTIASLTDLAEVTNVPESAEQMEQAEADKHHIAAAASEFSRFIGQNNLSMMDFLVERYDGEDYEYKTRTSNIVMKKTLMNMLAATTPTMLNQSLPPQVGGQGFLSRMILVYGAKKYKSIPRPSAPDHALVGRVKDTLNAIYSNMHGAFTETADGRAYSEGLYGYDNGITDTRFAYYAERRYTHLIKLAMVLAASRVDSCITRTDYEEAHRILVATELGMTEALGEFGMNPMAVLKQDILEQLRATQGPMLMQTLIAMFHRDASSRDIAEVVNDLIRVGQLKINQTPTGQSMISAVYSKQDTEDQMMKLLQRKPTQ